MPLFRLATDNDDIMNETTLMMLVSTAVIIAGGMALYALMLLKRQHGKMLWLQDEKSSATTEKNLALQQIESLKERISELESSKLDAEERAVSAEKRAALMEQKLSGMNERMSDWEKQKEESVQAARAAILKAGGEMSSKLLEDHKREAESARKDQEEKVRKATEDLFKQFNEVTQAVSAIREQSTMNREQMETVMRSLTSPGGAGAMSEVGLENSLKNLGLESGRDFFMQYHVQDQDGKGLRPDAVIFLPQDVVMVVDSKASKFLIELAGVEGTNKEEKVLKGLVKSMNDHLKALAGKNYRAAIQQSFKEAGRGDKLGHVYNVMYLPSEGAIERLRVADPEFETKLQKNDIILAGPASLAALFSMAKNNIAAARQAENQEVIVDTVKDLMESVVTAFGHVEGMGKSIASSMRHFNAFGKSVNARMLPRMRLLAELGVSTARHKSLPGRIATYEVHRSDDFMTLEAETPRPAAIEDRKASEKVHELKRETV